MADKRDGRYVLGVGYPKCDFLDDSIGLYALVSFDWTPHEATPQQVVCR